MLFIIWQKVGMIKVVRPGQWNACVVCDGFFTFPCWLGKHCRASCCCRAAWRKYSFFFVFFWLFSDLFCSTIPEGGQALMWKTGEQEARVQEQEVDQGCWVGRFHISSIYPYIIHILSTNLQSSSPIHCLYIVSTTAFVHLHIHLNILISLEKLTLPHYHSNTYCLNI